jgi:hypothetical protein
MFLAKTAVSFLFLGLTLATGCASSIRCDSEHDPGTDFTQLKTFDFLAGPPEEQGAERDAVLLGLVGDQLTAKGLQRTNSQPDLLVSVHRSIEGTVHTQKSGYEFRGGRLSRYQLQEGTLVVDLVAAKTKIAVWRGTASGAYRQDSLPEERRAKLTEVLRELFAAYPPGR